MTTEASARDYDFIDELIVEESCLETNLDRVLEIFRRTGYRVVQLKWCGPGGDDTSGANWKVEEEL